MRKRIIMYLHNHRLLHWLLWFFHRTIGKNQFVNTRGNYVNSTTANIYKNRFEFVKGKNNHVFIGDNSDLHNSSISIKGSENTILIGENGFLNGLDVIVEGDNNVVSIGANAFVMDDTRIYVVDGSSFLMGNGCMLSDHIEIRTTDNHSIIDIENDKRVNFEENVILHDNVWIGTGVIILKGSELAEGCIVGAGSVITRKHLIPNTIVAGNPGKEIRSGVKWKMERLKE